MVDINFHNIRSVKGSQQEGFEELVCQLAHLKPPKGAKHFVRKDGAGGDAGVECYWKLFDGSEHCWQAKYFVDSLEDGQWSQIDKSVNTALDKHPNLTKYYVCLPRDWNDSRKEVKGKVVTSAWDKWQSHVEKWKSLASSKGMNVKFFCWCKHEISLFLTSSDPKFSGRALYWFNQPVINSSILYEIANNSKSALGDRFSSEFHLDLPIAKVFEGIGQTGRWGRLLDENRSLLLKAQKNYLSNFVIAKEPDLIDAKWQDLKKALSDACSIFANSIEEKCFLDSIEKIESVLEKLIDEIDECSKLLYKKIGEEGKEGGKVYRELSGKLHRISGSVSDVNSFICSKVVRSARNKVLMILGEAGIGKSHLLCDLTFKRLEESLPTLFVLGYHYEGGNPIDFLGKSLDLSGVSRKQILGALDACGEAHRTRLLVIVDAINEGPYKDEWYNQISTIISELSNFENVALLLSCRTTYEDFLIPDFIDNNTMTRLQHHGFSGFEHRAASIYLSKQGISKPSAPIISPEFSNPLFLKTSCEALKSSGQDSFPKGLNGVTALFDFYIKNISKTINRKRKLLAKENVVERCLSEFIKAMYPHKLHGIPVSEARTLIDKLDSKGGSEETLFMLLIDEGILSFDIVPDPRREKRGVEVVRFTYERFSDHYLASHLIDLYTVNGKIDKLFSEGEFIDSLISENKVYAYSGVIEALGVIIPEVFEKELVDFFRTSDEYYEYFFKHTFLEALRWRSNDSFSQRTLELLKAVKTYPYHDERITILLSFSTEPNHPWNSDLLHKILKSKSLVERDSFWSTKIALLDQSEEDGETESVLRTIIEWSLFADLDDVDEERLRLTAKTLAWMTTTSNRRVRDHATKSLVKTFLSKPDLILKTLKDFDCVDDPYLQERLLAAAYGALCHVEEKEVILAVAQYVYRVLFKDGKPYPSLLLRDYGRGILEYANFKKLLPDEVDIEQCRPPYKSAWPLENPSDEKLKEMFGDTFLSAIMSSIMGFPGDFGNYTMRCVHNWSPTSLGGNRPQTGSELHREFAEKLPENLKVDFLKYLDRETNKEISISNLSVAETLKGMPYEKLDEFYENISIELEDSHEGPDDELTIEKLKKRINDELDADLKEEFRWISGLGINDRPAAISRKWLQRWVCKRAFDLGWTKERFEEFEERYCQKGRGSEKTIERIGKKYQWIAFREALATLSDNVHWRDRGYSDVEDSVFYGPWQVDERDIDPSLLIRKTYYDGWKELTEELWWRPFVFNLMESSLEEQEKWLYDRNAIPPFKELVSVKSGSNTDYLVLHGFSSWRKNRSESHIEEIADQDAWFRINSIIVKNEDVQKIKDKLINKENLVDPHTVSMSSTGHQTYYKEYPWHPSCQNMFDWVEVEEYWRNRFGVRHLVPVSSYEWERGNFDKSIEESINFYLPSETLIEGLKISSNLSSVGHWSDDNGDVVFLDPSVKSEGPSYALVRRDAFQKWLNENDLEIIWLIGGEKQLFGKSFESFLGRLTYNALVTYSDGRFDMETWFDEEKSRGKS